MPLRFAVESARYLNVLTIQRMLIGLFEFSNIAELIERILEENQKAINNFNDKSEMIRYIKEVIDYAEEECSNCAEVYSNGNC